MARFPPGYRLEGLKRGHARDRFTSGQPAVDRWLKEQALESHDKRLSSTRVLLSAADEVLGYFTLSTGQVDFGELPPELVRKLPKRALPVAVLAWLGVATTAQGRGLGKLLLAQGLSDCFEAGKVFPFIAVVLDCVDDAAKAFYLRWDFRELPGRPMRLFLSAKELEAMAGE